MDCIQKKEKFNLYEASGVKEYWINDPKAKTVKVFLLQPEGRYDLGTVYECDQNCRFIFWTNWKLI